MGDLIAGIAPQVDTYTNWVSANPTLGKDASGNRFNQMIFATGSPVGDILIWGNDQTFTASYAAGQYIGMGINIQTYSTAWLLNEIGGVGVGKWDNVHLGDDPSGDDNVTHSLDAPLSDLIVKVFISTDGTDANSFEVVQSTQTAASRGITFEGVDDDNIIVQTGSSGIVYIDSSGTTQALDTEDWYYKIKVYKLS